jgi:hypothetical protein
MAASWKPLVNQPKFNASTMLLLTDGSVMCQEAGALAWWRLRPDGTGSYINGTWSALAPMHHTRLYYASAVLKDGRVFVAGGEYSDAGSETNTAEIYNPLNNTWTVITAPAGWTRIGDAPCVVLPDGRVLVGQIDDQRTAIYDPAANTWSAAAQKLDRSSEESWVLMPDRTILTAQCTAHPGAEKYVIASNTWEKAGKLPNDLVEAASIEIGAGIVLPDGRAFYIGATPFTALYKPDPQPAKPGSWTAGPKIPKDAKGNTCGAKDAPACLQTNGHVLITVGPVDGVSGHYLGPTYFYEFTGTSLVKVPDAPNAGSIPYVGRMLLLPTGEVLYASGTQALYAYTPAPAYKPAWQPEILTLPASLTPGFSHTLTGHQLNGLSQAVGYGDDASAATNYPLVRLTGPKGNVYYCRTFDHSTMAVATGSTTQSTNFVVPTSVPAGSYELTVVANGIPSKGATIVVNKPISVFPVEAEWQWLMGSLADGPLWAIGPNGPVPVDPWGPQFHDDVSAAGRGIVAGIQALQKIGAQLEGARLTAAEAVPPAVEPEDEDDETHEAHGAGSTTARVTTADETAAARRDKRARSGAGNQGGAKKRTG